MSNCPGVVHMPMIHVEREEWYRVTSVQTMILGDCAKLVVV